MEGGRRNDAEEAEGPAEDSSEALEEEPAVQRPDVQDENDNEDQEEEDDNEEEAAQKQDGEHAKEEEEAHGQEEDAAFETDRAKPFLIMASPRATAVDLAFFAERRVEATWKGGERTTASTLTRRSFLPGPASAAASAATGQSRIR